MDTIEERTQRTKWFLHDRFGMFIHWGLYSIPARGEWVRHFEKMSNEQYQPYFDGFNPDRYDPREWARIAKQAGMKYAVLTAKHHDGFASSIPPSPITKQPKPAVTSCGNMLMPSEPKG